MNLIDRLSNLMGRASEPVVTPLVGSANLEASQSLFGSIANGRYPVTTTMDFIPKDGEGNVIQLNGSSSPNFMNLQNRDMQYWAYNFCSPLAAVIDRLAEADTNGQLELIKLDGTAKGDFKRNEGLSRIMKLLKKPNPVQTWEEFNVEQDVLCFIFGYCPVFGFVPAGMDKSYTKYLFNLNPLFTTPVYKDGEISVYKSGTTKEITGWKVTGGERTIPAKNVFVVRDGFINIQDTGLPLSKISGLDYAVSNLCAAMEADNVLLKKKGPLGIFTYDPKPDMAGWQPMTPAQKDDIQAEISQYGLTLGQYQHMISKLPMKWQSMSFNGMELTTKETIRQSTDIIADRFAYPAELMSGKNATYENRNSAEKYLYQNNTIPFSIRKMAIYTQWFELEEEYKVKFHMSFDHMPVLQEDIQKSSIAMKAKNEGLDIIWIGGLMTWNEYRIALQMLTVPGMDIYYPEYQKKFKTEKENGSEKTASESAGAASKSGNQPNKVL